MSGETPLTRGAFSTVKVTLCYAIIVTTYLASHDTNFQIIEMIAPSRCLDPPLLVSIRVGLWRFF